MHVTSTRSAAVFDGLAGRVSLDGLDGELVDQERGAARLASELVSPGRPQLSNDVQAGLTTSQC